ncbi:ABC transporter ATP-binding protein [Lichenifustis flavocetrariae]|uniref:Spermidine/putrescine import ATP-binding protein PotA n=1 Tax=Lichenifustis flavocetrariae TaxID=2949735 RepID=A0AA41YZP9_9HYPH|nr:ABC transporter ATP-binding protein [Lichenifustis flavocetrariae]MCW6507810.1 ABC transporter ATP-binding protein [Lichenifustis flavocetrariae]
MDAIVRYSDVSKTYDGVTSVVRNLNLDIEEGEFLTMLGPSGSGKTTSLMMLAGFEAPTSGEILLDGRSLARVPPHRRDIGMVFQNYALFPHMTVSENIAFPLQVRKRPAAEIEQRVKRALDMVHLSTLGGRRPLQLSGGQQQRVAVARALVFEPKIILMDEPLGALDRQLRESMQLEIRSIHERLGVTAVYVTHDQGEALTMSDRIAIFSNGAIEQLGSPEELYSRPSNAFVAQFIGENNLMPCAVARTSGLECEAELAGSGPVRARYGDLSPGQTDGVVAVRPEKVRVRPKSAMDSSENSFSAVVEAVVFFGDHVKLALRLAGGQKLVSRSLPEDTATFGVVGQELTVGWNTQDCAIYAPRSRPAPPIPVAFASQA